MDFRKMWLNETNGINIVGYGWRAKNIQYSMVLFTGESLLNRLLAMKGCDSTSALFRKRFKKAFKV